MADKPEPFVPADVDLRGMEYMPLKGDVLFKSTTWLKCSPEARCAALRLWWHAFGHEVPSASLPNDDQLLAEYAGYGGIPRAWLKIKAEAMRGWVLCSDGRWYHRTVAELALEAWKGRVRNRDKVRKWREKKAGGNQSGTPDGNPTGNQSGNGNSRQAVPVRNHLESESESESKDREERVPPLAAASPTAARESPIEKPKAAAANGGPRAAMAERDLVDEAFKRWSALAQDLKIADAGYLNSDRRAALTQRLTEIGGLEGWDLFLGKIREAKFLFNSNGLPKFWVGLGKLLEPEHFSKLLEDRYAEHHERARDDGERSVAAALAGVYAAGSR